MTRRKPAVRSKHDRWLVSYADFMTLLFAFFVVLFASSQADRGQAGRLSKAVERAFDGQPSGRFAAVASPVPTLEDSLAQLQNGLQAEVQSGKVRLSLEQRGLVVSLSQAGFFPSGEDAIDPSTYRSLEIVARAIRPLSSPIRLEGHTDSVPIHTGRFRSNWDLSAARAIAVLELLRDKWGVPPRRLAISGYGDTAPVDLNQTEEGRAKNRRVDVVVLRDSAAAREPETRNR